jgi:hypothetical protein
MIDDIEFLICHERMDDTINERMDDTINERMDDTINERMADTINERMDDTINEHVYDNINEHVYDNINEHMNDTIEKVITSNIDTNQYLTKYYGGFNNKPNNNIPYYQNNLIICQLQQTNQCLYHQISHKRNNIQQLKQQISQLKKPIPYDLNLTWSLVQLPQETFSIEYLNRI